MYSAHWRPLYSACGGHALEQRREEEPPEEELLRRDAEQDRRSCEREQEDERPREVALLDPHHVPGCGKRRQDRDAEEGDALGLQPAKGRQVEETAQQVYLSIRTPFRLSPGPTRLRRAVPTAGAAIRERAGIVGCLSQAPGTDAVDMAVGRPGSALDGRRSAARRGRAGGDPGSQARAARGPPSPPSGSTPAGAPPGRGARRGACDADRRTAATAHPRHVRRPAAALQGARGGAPLPRGGAPLRRPRPAGRRFTGRLTAPSVASGFVEVADEEEYREHHHEVPLKWPTIWLQVEVHESLRWPSYARGLSPAEMFAAAGHVGSSAVDGLEALHPVHHALFLASHAWLDEPLYTLRDLIDIAAVSEGVDESEIARAASAIGIARLWNTTRGAVDSLFGEGDQTFPLRTWARHLAPVRDRTVFEHHLQRWLHSFSERPVQRRARRDLPGDAGGDRPGGRRSLGEQARAHRVGDQEAGLPGDSRCRETEAARATAAVGRARRQMASPARPALRYPVARSRGSRTGVLRDERQTVGRGRRARGIDDLPVSA